MASNAPESNSTCLLFLDYFSHVNSSNPAFEEKHCDIVFFNQAVQLYEARIVPFGMKISTDAPGEPTVGLTGPSQFSVEFFAREKQDAGTYTPIGEMRYDEKSGFTNCSLSTVYTDLVLIRGSYSSITIGLFGKIAGSPAPSLPPTIQQQILPPPHQMLQQQQPAGGFGNFSNLSTPSYAPMQQQQQAFQQQGGGTGRDNQQLRLPMQQQQRLARSVRQFDFGFDEPSSRPWRDAIPGNRRGRPLPLAIGARQKRPSEIETADSVAPVPPVEEFENFEFGEVEDSSDELSDADADTGLEIADEDLGIPLAFHPDRCRLKELRFPTDPSFTAFEVEKKLLYDSVEPTINSKDEARGEESASKLAELLNKFSEASTHNSEWIEQLEHLPAYLPAALAFDESINLAEFETTIDTLIEWTLEGLDLKAAERKLGEDANIFIMRQLKMGINMVGILCTLSHSVNEKIFPKKVQSRLLELMNIEHIATPMKLLIMRSLNNTTRLSSGADAFIGRESSEQQRANVNDQTESAKFTEPARVLGEDETAHLRKCLERVDLNTPYKQLVALLFRNHTTRVMNAIANLLNKLHFYEMLLDFKELFHQFKATERHASAGDESAEKSVAELADKLSVFLGNIRASYTNAPQSMAQARSCLPASSKFESKLKPYDVYPDLYQYFTSIRLIDCLRAVICDCKLQLPELHNLKLAACSVLQPMLSFEHGVQFLAAQPIAMQAIINSLNPDLSPDDQQMNEDAEEAPQECLSLSLQLLYKLLTVYHLDQLMVFHKLHSVTKTTMENEQLIASMHELYLMTASMPQGTRWVADLILTEDSLPVLLPFIEAEIEEKPTKAKRQRRRAAVQKYCLSLIASCVRFTDGKQFPEVFGSCGTRLLSAAVHQKSRTARELFDWLLPVKAVPPPYDLECMDKLLQNLKSTVDLIHTTCPPGLITLLRILRTLTVPPDAFRHKEDPSLWSVQNLEPPVKELRFQFAMVTFLSVNGISLLGQIINKLLQQVTPGWQRGIEFLDDNFYMTLFALEPAVQLLTVLLQSAIQAMGSKFRNFSMIDCLFKTFAAVCSFPSASLPPYYIDVIGHIHTAVIDSLLAFSQTALPSAGEHEKALNDSQWTCVIRKVLKLTVSAPSCFLGGLTIIGELLPLPLPVHIRPGSKVTESELSASVTLRKLVSAHLLCLGDEIGEVLELIGGSTNPFLNQVFRRVVSQIGDLSCPTAMMLSERATKIFLAKWQPFASQLNDWLQQQQQPHGDAVPDASELARALNMMSIMLTISSVKLAFLRAAAEPQPEQSSVFADGPPASAGDFYSAAAQLLDVRSFSENVLRCQELIVNCLCSLLDADITLEMPLTKSGRVKVTWQTLANSIPPMHQLQQVAQIAFAHVKHPASELATVHQCLKLLVLLAEHDAGFCLVKSCVESADGVFLELMKRVNTKFSKDNPDCLNTLLTALELLRTLVITDTLEGEAMPLRSQAVSFGEIKAMLAWKSDADGAREHTVFELHHLLREYAKEESSLEGLLESMDSLIEMLNQAPDSSPQESQMPQLPEPQPLVALFQRRAVFASSSGARQEEAQERLLSDYWFGLAAPDEAEAEPELMRCNLEELAKSACPGFNLHEELEKDATRTSGEEAVRHKRRRHEHDAIIETSQQKRFVAPMRGRGFNLRPGGAFPTQRVNDSFRSRPPNTSRPPSMHVDDFAKLENSAQVEKLGSDENRGDSGNAIGSISRGGGHFRRGGIGEFGLFEQRRRFGYTLVQLQQQQQPRSTYGARGSGRRDRCSIRPLHHK